jgi:hypothetical protein
LRGSATANVTELRVNFVTGSTMIVTEFHAGRKPMVRGRKPMGDQAMTAAERQRRHRSSEAVQRRKPIKVIWSKDGARLGRITINGTHWAAVEWSEKRQAWCIEDAEGKCLQHAESIRGQVSTKEEAVALAVEMIRDGRMPSPEQAKAEQKARREARYAAKKQTSSAIAAREARTTYSRVLHENFDADKLRL